MQLKCSVEVPFRGSHHSGLGLLLLRTGFSLLRALPCLPTAQVGQPVVVGAEWGKVKALRSTAGGAVGREGVSPGRPVEVIGLRGLPLAGDELLGVASEDRAQRVSKARAGRVQWRREAEAVRVAAQAAAQLADEDAPGVKLLPVVLKADVQGSAEAVREAVANLSTEAVRVMVVHCGVGPVSLSDVALAVPSGAAVLGFNVKAATEAEAEAKQHGVGLHCRRVIYELLADVAALVEGASPKEKKEVIEGVADVLAVFPLSKKRGSAAAPSAVAGCKVVEGAVRAGLRFRVLRGGEVLHEGPCDSLRRHKLAVDSVGRGSECGVVLDGFQDFRPGDVLQCVDER